MVPPAAGNVLRTLPGDSQRLDDDAGDVDPREPSPGHQDHAHVALEGLQELAENVIGSGCLPLRKGERPFLVAILPDRPRRSLQEARTAAPLRTMIPLLPGKEASVTN